MAISNRVHSTKKARVDTSSFSFRLPSIPEGKKLKMKKFVERYSRVGIYSLRDVLVDQDDAKDSPMQTPLYDEDVLKTYENFKKFDIVVDHSDHLFSACTSPMMQASVCVCGVLFIELSSNTNNNNNNLSHRKIGSKRYRKNGEFLRKTCLVCQFIRNSSN